MARELTPRTAQETEEEERAERAFWGMDEGDSEHKPSEAVHERPNASFVCPTCMGTNLDVDDDLDVLCGDCGEYWVLEHGPVCNTSSDEEAEAINFFRMAWKRVDRLARSTIAQLDATDALTLAYRQFTDWCVQAQLCDLGHLPRDYYYNVARQPNLCKLISELTKRIARLRALVALGREEADACIEHGADDVAALEDACLELLAVF